MELLIFCFLNSTNRTEVHVKCVTQKAAHVHVSDEGQSKILNFTRIVVVSMAPRVLRQHCQADDEFGSMEF